MHSKAISSHYRQHLRCFEFGHEGKHHTQHQCSLLQGAWGFWYLPGDPSFHVNWTGVAEIAGGVGCVLGSQNIGPDWLLPASAFGLFLLTAVVSPSNIYMWTHNAAPLTEEQLDELPGGAIDWKVHVVRGALQVVLLATYLGLALHNY